MQLTEHKPGNHYFVRDITDEGIRVVDTRYAGSVIFSMTELNSDWPVRSVNDLNEQTLEPIWAMKPELVILGTGRRQRFPDREVQLQFLRRQIGLEVMSLDAAARTFNVLASEGRRAVAALVWPGD